MGETLTEFHLEYSHFIKPLIVGTLVSLVCSVVGCFIILRRLSFLSDAIAHSMLAGVVIGYLVMKIAFGEEAHVGAMLLGAMIAGILTVAAIGFVTRVSRIKQDTAIGVMYTGIFGLGAFIISIDYFSKLIHIDIYHFIVGSVVAVSDTELWIAGIVSALVLSAILLFYRQLQLTSFDPVMAASIGIPVMAVDYLLTACTSLVVVSGVRIAGVILVVALIITPAASAYLLFDRLNRMIYAAAAIGVGCFWVGFWMAHAIGASPGSSIVLISTLFFLATLTLAPRYGLLADWLRIRNAVPLEVKEDVLGSVLRNDSPQVAVSEIVRRLETSGFKVRKAIRTLIRQDLLESHEGSVALTPEGRREARRLLRAHRLWETYLSRVGTPAGEVHGRAHKLEHLNDEETVDYLDDKLGHPILDPHGSEIPEDFVHLEGDGAVKSSLLREGYRARVVNVLTGAAGHGLRAGDEIVAGPRSEDGQIWHFATTDGLQVQLNHDQADQVLVELIGETG